MQWFKKFLSHKDSGSGQENPPGSCEITSETVEDLAELGEQKLNIGGIIARMFIDSKTTLLIMIAALVFGLFALFITPREENPQITVPSVNVIVPFPGASPQEVEKLVIRPLERLIWDIKGVEHIYSTAYPDFGVVTAQFYVGQDQDASVFKVYETVYSNLDLAPQGSQSPLVKPVDINDVPMMSLTLFSDTRTEYELRQTAHRIMNDLRLVPGTGESSIVGGDEREITVAIDPVKAASYAITPQSIAESLAGANLRMPTDRLEHGGERLLVRSGQYLRNVEEVGSVVITTMMPSDSSPVGRPIYLRDVAEIYDGSTERTNYSRISFSALGMHTLHGGLAPGTSDVAGRKYNAVTIAIAKQKGTNSVTIAEELLKRMDEIAPLYLDGETSWAATRNDGETADEAVNELLHHLTWAIVIVIALLIIFLGWRDSMVVAMAIPITMLVTLGIGLLAGQTINRITLFALILSLGLLVDDAIVVVENIHRHIQMGRKQGLLKTCISAVNEIATPTIYATLVVVVSMVPMAFVTGMMGPYMGPIPFNVPVAMVISLIVAFKITPYLSVRWLKVHPKPAAEGAGLDETQGANPTLLRMFRRMMLPLMENRTKRNWVFGIMIVALMVSFTFPLFQWVKFRMLPKANVKTFLVQVDLPAGSALNRTAGLASDIEDLLVTEPEVINVLTTVGTGSVTDFNGLLRGTSFRTGPHQADLRVNLTHKTERRERSEDMVLRLRPEIMALAEKYDAKVKLIEDPPGPPVRSTLLAEIYGPYGELQRQQVDKVRGWLSETAEVTDIDDSVSTVAEELRITVDEDKTVRAGLKVADVTMALRAALAGYPVTMLHDPADYVQTPVVLRFPAEYRSTVNDLNHITLPTPVGTVPLRELVNLETGDALRPVYHKDLQPVSYVYGEMANRSSVYANIDLLMREQKEPLPGVFKLKWEGEWDLTLKVFRDLGIAMGVAILLIYLLLVGRFRNFLDPIVLMGAVPLTMLGILPGFAIIGAWNIYFSATGMIGVIALSGIVTRNSIILIEFIQDSMDQGMSLKDAVLYSAVIRARPIFLTAVTAMAGMLMMISDPVWSGLSWALLFGIAASTPLSLVIIPVLYYVVKSRGMKEA